MAIYKLKDVCNYVEGYVNPLVDDPTNFENNGFPWLKVSELIHGGYVTNSSYKISRKVLDSIKSKNQFFQKGTIVWSKSGSIGNTSILKIDCTANRGILNIINKKEKILNKFLFYFLTKNKNVYALKGIGAVLKHFYGPNLMNEKINLPSLELQKEIIDIIEPNEKFFLKYSNCIRIDTLENVSKDIQNLIDIIEPFENLQSILFQLKDKFKNLLIMLYKTISFSNTVSFDSLIKLINTNYEFQEYYFATNAIGELEIDYSKIIKLSENLIPSRANLSPKAGSFIISKLDGENKIFYFKNKPCEVFSTGFFNFETKYSDYIFGFLLSNDFKNQKMKLSTGTTMRGINNSALKNILLNKPKSTNKIISEFLFDLEKENIKIKSIKEKLIKLLVK